ncbi:hypothetical protein IL306_006550 [Fusarium sp. DS 682]|nr:hypothetical protein IL306_006550 [Fusarium sp. DS 682]
MSSSTTPPSDMHPDMELIDSIMDKQPVRMFTRNCIPPKDPPPGEPVPCTWRCTTCNEQYKLSITSRCLECQSTKRTRTKRRRSDAPTSAPSRRQKVPRRVYPTIDDFDYEFWAIHNDWRRFRSAYERNPQKWERRINHNLEGVSSTQRRARRFKIEVKTRTQFTENRLKRMLRNGHNCELDCDYPSQCQTERYEASTKEILPVTNGRLHPTWYDEEDVKLPLCELLPEFDQEMPMPEDVVNEDEILAAYKRDVDAWFASSGVH